MKKVDHIGIAVASLEESMALYTEQLGMTHMKTETVESQGVNVAFIDAGNMKIELLEPTSPDSPIAKFLEKRGQGIHHIAYSVQNIESRIAEMKERGIQMINESPKLGAGGAHVAFMHPKSTGGVLMELCEKKEEI
ncbi:methylmalonyl-CoA epimerase [Domibacillus epiphyticus]|uniref:Methylmalonyl-CoA epimerase n=1 Tax=Domibacillus epiphyticus TaxID=1714355 RepID=A0A1V2AA97_9BACI|nr:methylmalonyl-CoA epimerase [Domibacillus epiphyticus]OMP67734.1 methylmalonyl-CoA epimerase [Domibacillus epiphyticus]